MTDPNVPGGAGGPRLPQTAQLRPPRTDAHDRRRPAHASRSDAGSRRLPHRSPPSGAAARRPRSRPLRPRPATVSRRRTASRLRPAAGLRPAAADAAATVSQPPRYGQQPYGQPQQPVRAARSSRYGRPRTASPLPATRSRTHAARPSRPIAEHPVDGRRHHRRRRSAGCTASASRSASPRSSSASSAARRSRRPRASGSPASSPGSSSIAISLIIWRSDHRCSSRVARTATATRTDRLDLNEPVGARRPAALRRPAVVARAPASRCVALRVRSASAARRSTSRAVCLPATRVSTRVADSRAAQRQALAQGGRVDIHPALLDLQGADAALAQRALEVASRRTGRVSSTRKPVANGVVTACVGGEVGDAVAEHAGAERAREVADQTGPDDGAVRLVEVRRRARRPRRRRCRPAR